MHQKKAAIFLPACFGLLISFHSSFSQTSYVLSHDSVRIAYEVHGSSTPALVFVHGWSCDRSYWNDQLKSFAPEFMVVAIDLGGHGESGLGRKSWSMESFGSDVAAVVNKLGLQRVILIGHSMGGDVIAEAARLLKKRVAGLIMVDTYKKLGSGRTPQQVQAFVGRLQTNFRDSTKAFVQGMFLPGSDPALVKRVSEDMASAPPAVALSALEHALSYGRQMPHTLKELKIPVIAINPDNETTDVPSMEQYGVKLMFMPGTGHFLMMEDPPRFNRILRSAINEIIK
ncbi:MAG TPA: alpha/beta hydrolase [Chitinophagaceae bacterium]